MSDTVAEPSTHARQEQVAPADAAERTDRAEQIDWAEPTDKAQQAEQVEPTGQAQQVEFSSWRDVFAGPIYPRVLRLRHVYLSAWQRALLVEGVMGIGAVLALADVITAWAPLILPVAVGGVVKFHDVLIGVLQPDRVASRPEPEVREVVEPVGEPRVRILRPAEAAPAVARPRVEPSPAVAPPPVQPSPAVAPPRVEPALDVPEPAVAARPPAEIVLPDEEEDARPVRVIPAPRPAETTAPPIDAAPAPPPEVAAAVAPPAQPVAVAPPVLDVREDEPEELADREPMVPAELAREDIELLGEEVRELAIEMFRLDGEVGLFALGVDHEGEIVPVDTVEAYDRVSLDRRVAALRAEVVRAAAAGEIRAAAVAVERHGTIVVEIEHAAAEPVVLNLRETGNRIGPVREAGPGWRFVPRWGPPPER